MARALRLLKNDDEQSGIVSRQDVIALTRIALRVQEIDPKLAADIQAVARRVRSTIPTSAWADEVLVFPMCDPLIGMEPTT